MALRVEQGHKIGESVVPVIITNKHVVNYNENEVVTFLLHTANDRGEPDGNLKITYNTNWIFHDKKDICYCYVNPLFEEIQRRFGKNIYAVFNDETIIADSAKLIELSALEELVMVGYPIGLVDMACFPGSSGSPIFILNEGGYKDKKGNSYFGASRIILLGYLFAGPQYTATGQLEVKNIPTQQTVTSNTPVMVNLGYYVKGKEILDFKNKTPVYNFLEK